LSLVCFKGISLKKADPVDLQKALQSYIACNYSADESKAVQAKVSEIGNLRTTVSTISANHDTSLTDIESLRAYYKQLCSMSVRFPFGSHNAGWLRSKVSTVKVAFSWYDSIRKKRKQDYSVHFEMAAVLYNIGALYSKEAIRKKRSMDELKEACTLFNQAAGVFDYIAGNDDLNKWGDENDMSVDNLKMVSALMIAQAQACFFEKACANKVSPTLVAKLAAGTAQLFNVAESACSAALFRNAVYPWQRHCHYQYLAYSSSACYWQAKHAITQCAYGEEIAWLQKARSLLTASEGFQSNLTGDVAATKQILMNAINERLREATSDNDKIYFNPITKQADLPQLEPKIVVKATAFAAPAPDPSQEDPFSRLVPAQVHEQAAKFKADAADFCTGLRRQGLEDAEAMKAALHAMNLPAALEAFSTAAGLPEELWSKIRDIQYKGGFQALQTLQANLAAAVQAASSMHAEAKEQLDKEFQEDQEMREKFSAQWNRRSSKEITVDLQRSVEEIDSFFQQAQQTDSEITKSMRENEASFVELMQSKASIETSLPAPPSAGQKPQACIALEGLLQQLSSLQTQREEICSSLDKACETLDIIPGLLSKDSKGKTVTDVTEEGMASLKAQEAELVALKTSQDALLQQITGQNADFVRTREKNDIVAARASIIQNLHGSINTFNRLMDNLSEGLKFYTELASTKISPLQQNIHDFCMARNMEKRVILDQLTNDLSKASLTDTGNSRSGLQEPAIGVAVNPNAWTGAPQAYAFTPQPTAVAAGQVPPPMQHGQVPAPAGYAVPAPTPTNPVAPSPYAPVFVVPPNQYQPHDPAVAGAPAGVPGGVPGGLPLGGASMAAAPAGAKWACQVCTFLNEAQHLACSMCNTPKAN